MTAAAPTELVRKCAGCGKRKVMCPCWAAGAGDEARHQREGFTRDQLALMDYLRGVLGYNVDPVPALVDALRIEFAGESIGFWQRLRVAWRVVFG